MVRGDAFAAAKVSGGEKLNFGYFSRDQGALHDFLDLMKTRAGCFEIRVRGWGRDFAGSQRNFPGRDSAPVRNQPFKARIKLACHRTRMPVAAVVGAAAALAVVPFCYMLRRLRQAR